MRMKDLAVVSCAQAAIIACFVASFMLENDFCNCAVFLAILTLVIVVRYPSGNLGRVTAADFKALVGSKPMAAICVLQILIMVISLIPSGDVPQAGCAAAFLGVPVLSIALAGYCVKEEMKSRS